jgi:predicted nucleic acid-binding protein
LTRVPKILAAEAPNVNTLGALTWVRTKALWVEPSPLGKQRSRDIKDERFLAAALAADAKAIVSYDRDLLVLEKPFGISIMRPARFLDWMEELLHERGSEKGA